jgi:hypothetical protein
VLHASGEELFLNGLVAPYRDRALAMIREQVHHVDRFIAVSEYCAAFMADFLAIPHRGSRWSAWHLYGRVRAAAEARDEFRVGYFARVAPKKGFTCWLMRTHACGAERGGHPFAWKQPGISPPPTRRT